MKMMSRIRKSDATQKHTFFKTRTIVLMGYLLLQLQLLDAKSLNGDQIQSGSSENDGYSPSFTPSFTSSLPKDGQELSLFPDSYCNCGDDRQNQNSEEDTQITPNSFQPSDNFPFEIVSQVQGGDFQTGNDVEVIMPRSRGSGSFENFEKSQKLQASQPSQSPKPEEAEDPNVIKQVIFIEPPEYVYKHDIKLEPRQKQQQPRLRIYVFPPMVKHIYNITDRRDLSKVKEEPQVFYLGKQHFDHFDDEMMSKNGLEIVGQGNYKDDGESSAKANLQNMEAPSYLPPPPIKRNSEITQESRQSYATTKIEDVKISSHRITERESLPIFSQIVTTTTSRPLPPPPQKQYRRFDYFSKTDYEELKSMGQLSPNSVQYRTGPLLIPPPTPKTFPVFTFPTTSNRIFEQVTTYRPITTQSSSVKNSQIPVVRLEYERVQHFPQQQQKQQEYASTQNDGSLSLPPLPTGNDYLPKAAWEWGHQVKDNDKKPNSFSIDQNAKSGRITFPRDDMDSVASGSELKEEKDYQIIPAFFKNYYYQGPTSE